MHFKFKFTDAERREVRRLNKLADRRKWQSYLIAFVSLLPSFILLFFTNSFIAIAAGGLVLCLMLAIVLLAAIQQETPGEPKICSGTVTKSLFHEFHSHCEYQTRMDMYDEFLESDKFLLFGHLKQYSAIPKRVLSESDLAEAKTFGQLINDRNDRNVISETGPNFANPIELFSRLFPKLESSSVYRFQYQQEDLTLAASEKFQLVKPDEIAVAEVVVKQTLIGKLFWPLIAIGTLVFLIRGDYEPRTMINTIIVVAAFILPFVLLNQLNKWWMSRSVKDAPEVHREINYTQLLRNGWAIGHARSCQLFDWRDVKSFYQNRFCIAVRTCEDLLFIIPKRIFSGEHEYWQFLNQAISYRKDYLRSFDETVNTKAPETGNPYQPPKS